MTTKGIIFSAPMVRALLDGRKTQTRRLFKPRGIEFYTHPESGDRYDQYKPYRDGSWDASRIVGSGPMFAFGWQEGLYGYLPYAPGDRLYVREAFGPCPECGYLNPREGINRPSNCAACDASVSKFKPSIHMPRWASRLWLAVSEVRVERLQDISEADAIAEGIDAGASTHFGDPIKSYAALWNHLHGAENDDSWEANPWIVAISFEVNKGNIDG